MKQFYRLVSLTLACCIYFSSKAQTSCSADFNYSVGYNKVVSFVSKDTLGTSNRWIFGDGSSSTSNTAAFTHQYAQPGQYEVKHIIEKSGIHCRDSVAKTITVTWRDTCFAYFTYERVRTNLSALTYQFSNASSSYSGAQTITWNFGEGSPSSDPNPTHTYSHAGTYQVCLKIETNAGCKSEFCQQLVIKDSSCNIKASFTHRQDTLDCKKVYFANASSPVSSAVHFTWNFGDGTSSHDASISHTYAQAGKYYVCLVSEGDSNCRSQYCDSVIVNCTTACNIASKFAWKKDSSNCKKIIFTNQAAPVSASTHFAWSFGDSTYSADANPSHIYTKAGTYSVCLVAESGSNCRAQSCTTVTVGCDTACTIVNKFAWKKDSSDCKKIIFSNLSAPVSAATHYTWNFGDGTSSHDASISHVYSQPGRYAVCLVSETGSNCRKEICDSITVVCDNACNIINKFAWRKDSSDCKKIIFSNLSAGVSAATSYAWNFGDGTSSHDVNPAHVYAQPGRYPVCLVSETGSNCRKEYCDSITITCGTIPHDTCTGKANFTHTISTTNPLIVAVTASYQKDGVKYAWNFGDGSTADAKYVYHTYSKAGRYIVCLTATDGNCKTTRCDSISVGVGCDYVTLKYEYSAKSTQPNVLSFKAVSNEQVLAQIWTIYRGDSASLSPVPVATLFENNPTYLFRDSGLYRVCLKTITSSLCAKEYCSLVRIASVKNGGREALVISPNPAINTIALDVTLDRAEQVSIKIVDGSGTIRAVFSEYGVAGGNRFTLPVSNLKPGIYLVQITTSTKVLISRFVKG